MAKRKYYEIEKDSSEEEIKEKSKRAKTRESDVSDRTATLSIKKKKAQEFQKIKSREQKKKETAAKNLKNIMDRGDSSEKIIECGARDSDSSGKNIFKKKDESGLIRISSIQENQENSLDNKKYIWYNWRYCCDLWEWVFLWRIFSKWILYIYFGFI